MALEEENKFSPYKVKLNNVPFVSAIKFCYHKKRRDRDNEFLFCYNLSNF